MQLRNIEMMNSAMQSTNPLNLRTYVSYLRVSTQKQGRSGLGLESQRSIIAHYTREGILAREFLEVESAKTFKDRAILHQAIDYCVENNCILIVAKLDRLSRDVEDTFSLIKQLKGNIAICDIPFDSIDSFTLAIFAGLAQRERELISIRTKQALDELRKKGRKFGTPENLIGCISGTIAAIQVIKNFYSRRTLIAIVEKYLREGVSYERLAVILNQEGFRTYRGNKYNKVSVCRLLKNIEKYSYTNILE